MENKIYFKNYLKLIIILSVISIIIFLSLSKIQYHKYRNNVNNKINGIISEIIKVYPNVTVEELVQLLSNNESYNNALKEYGYDLENDDIIKENEELYHRQIVINLLFIGGVWITILIVFYNYDYKKEKKINEITNYIREINKRNYQIDISDNNEDELSILKNELYKTTIMLRELADNSLKDKMELKKSLEDISHQLKTPLTSIIILLDNIIDNPEMDNKTKDEFISDIKKQTLNINFLVQSLLKLSKFDVNVIHFDNKKNSLNKIITESVKNVESICDLKNIKIEINNQDSVIYCDYKWQVEAITNILKNAVEHAYSSSVIKINIENNKIYSKVTIINSGVGIDKKDLNHIFERFYKGKNSVKDSIGIGLSLSKKIIEKNNGIINVKSEKNKETMFEIKYFN